MLISKAPAKLILAGEHGVLYGVPAITTSINWFTQCYWQASTQLTLEIAGQSCGYSLQDLSAHWQLITQRHAQWLTQPDTVILQTLNDLPLLVLAWWQKHHPLALLDCRIDSEIPVGSGLGSSASVIIAMLRGLVQWHQQTWSLSDYQRVATELEHFAHGRSSGLDVSAILHEQVIWWQDQQAKSLPLPPLTGYLVDTGRPLSTTAECVRHVRQHHADHSVLWLDMRLAVTELSRALQAQKSPLASVRRLHQLLTTLGIIPPRVQAFTRAIETLGWAGKLCGAGSISGETGGFYWLIASEPPTEICQQFAYPYWSLYDLSSQTSTTTH